MRIRAHDIATPRIQNLRYIFYLLLEGLETRRIPSHVPHKHPAVGPLFLLYNPLRRRYGQCQRLFDEDQLPRFECGDAQGFVYFVGREDEHHVYVWVRDGFKGMRGVVGDGEFGCYVVDGGSGDVADGEDGESVVVSGEGE